MICAPGPVRFRLLDPIAGWEADQGTHTSESIVLDDPAGLRLKRPDGAPADVLSQYIPPSWFAKDVGPCHWHMLDDGAKLALRRWDVCSAAWVEWLERLAGHETLTRLSSLAIRGPHLAIADREGGHVLVWSWENGRLLARIPVENPGAVAFAPWGELVVAVGPAHLKRYDLAGEPRLPDLAWTSDDPIQRLAAGRDGALWVANGPDQGPFKLDRIGFLPGLPSGAVGPLGTADLPASADIEPLTGERHNLRHPFAIEHNVTADRLTPAFPATGLTRDPRSVVCLEIPDGSGSTEVRCFGRDGKQARPDAAEPAAQQNSNPPSGTLVTKALDSGIPRCRWHRVQLDADIPPGAEVVVEVATVEDPKRIPEDGDWETLANPQDALILTQPAGRFLFARITLVQGARGGPVVRRLRVEFPRSTGLDRLPGVYRDNPDAEDFTERFLALFDASLADIDRVITSFASLLDPATVSPEVLNWIGSMFGVTFDPEWDLSRRRGLIQALPALEQKRGTVEGLALAIRLLFDVEPAIQERSLARSWGALGFDARLGSVRLFGKARSRFRLGRSALGAAPLRSYGNPDLDPFRDKAHRFNVLVPSVGRPDSKAVERLDRLIADQKPAHTMHTLRVGGPGLVIGPWSAVGIDTRLSAPDPPVLGARASGNSPGNVRLNRMSILRRGARARPRGLIVGQAVLGHPNALE
jgi:phage tail-like protein